MAIKLDDAMFNQASKQAMQKAFAETAEERFKAMGSSAFSRILDELKKSAVDKDLIAKFESDINAASDKNQAILNVINKGGGIADALLRILK